MATRVFCNRILTVFVRYLDATRPSGLLFYRRRVPDDLRQFWGGRRLIRQSLKTRDLKEAAKRIAELAKRDDALFRTYRGTLDDVRVSKAVLDDARALVATWGKKPGDGKNVGDWEDYPHEDYLEDKYGRAYTDIRYNPDPRADRDAYITELLTPTEDAALHLLYEGESPPSQLISDACRIYLADHKKAGDKRLIRDTERAIGLVISTVGDFPLARYTRSQASMVKDVLLDGRRTATAKRRLSTINAVFAKGIKEFELPNTNPFRGLDIPNLGQDAEDVEPFTLLELRRIAQAALHKDDDIRHIVAMQMDTGARITEIVGLRCEDVSLQGPVPFIDIRPHERLGHTLKTPNSRRSVPLVGMALWGATRALEGKCDGWLFPRYASDGLVKGDTASGAVNSWLEKASGVDKESHSFRHAMRDRLLGADVREEVAEAIMGHGGKSVHRGYGAGFKVSTLKESLAKVAIDPSSIPRGA